MILPLTQGASVIFVVLIRGHVDRDESGLASSLQGEARGKYRDKRKRERESGVGKAGTEGCWDFHASQT